MSTPTVDRRPPLPANPGPPDARNRLEDVNPAHLLFVLAEKAKDRTGKLLITESNGELRQGVL